MGNKKIVYYNNNDLFALIICIGFVIMGLISPHWPSLIFFGFGVIILSYKFINPKNKTLHFHSTEAKEIREREFEDFKNSNGNFQFYDWGFVKIIGKEEFILEWNNVKKITTYKRDLMTEDQICLEIETVDDIVFTTSEDTEGWFQLIKHLAKEFPAVNEENIMKIAHPAFERNETVLFSR